MKTLVTKNGLPPNATLSLEELGRRLRALRKSRGYSRDRLASLMYVSRNTLVRMEAGDPGVSIGAWTQALHLLGDTRNLMILLDEPKVEWGAAKRKKKNALDLNALAESL